MKTTSESLRFVGANIKGTPAMSADKVRADLKELKKTSDVIVVQEFKWRWYWNVLSVVLPFIEGRGWVSYPSIKRALERPARSASAAFWRRRMFRAKERREMILHDGRAGISDTRWIRGVLLKEKASKLSCWYTTWHNVVGGDSKHDPEIRREMLDIDLKASRKWLKDLHATGHPIIGEIDANIHQGTNAFYEWREIVQSFGGRFYGDLGVEYLFVIDGTDGTEVLVRGSWVVPTSILNTDHEARGLTYRLRGEA